MDIGNISIDFHTFCTQASGILGIRGSGKTFSATYIAEQLLEWGCPITVIDPSGVWKNIKIPNGADGKGYDVVVIGNADSDIVIDEFFTPDDIVDIVTRALENNVSFIFDLYRTEVSNEVWGEILTLAFQTIYLKNRGIRQIIIEESATFIPQNQKAFSKDLYNILEQITRVGGNAQLGIAFVSQRAEQLNKQCLELCDLMIFHRQRGNNSLKTIKNWLSMGIVSDEDIERVLESLPTLGAGEAWILEQESKTPHRVCVPPKKSLHPDRARFTDEYLNKSLTSDTRGFLESIKQSESADFISSELFGHITEIIEQEINRVEVVIDESELGFLDRHTLSMAKNTSYGSSTVKDIIDSVVGSGYTHLDQTFRYLKNGSSKTFMLESDVLYNYAKLVVSKLARKNT